jgi:phosphotransferase system enzyme I (PtsP)
VVRTIAPFDTKLTVCGEMGGRRMEALALLGLGITRLSITPAAVGPIKELIQQVDLGQIRAAMDDWLAHPPADIRQALADWASAHGIDCD